MDLSYILNHLGENRESYMQAVSPPIFQTSNFTFKDVETMRASIADELNTPFYTRGCNPTVAILRKKIAALESAEDSLIFGSGVAAGSAAIISQLKAGDHIVSVSKPYSWTKKLFSLFLDRFNIETTYIDGTNSANYKNAIKPNTKLFFMESPNSMTFEMQDIEEVCKIAKANGICTIIDNSYASPLNQKPIEMGCDLVFHSATKYLAGHSDVVCGVLAGSNEKIKEIFASEYMTLGGIISPNDAWLLMRGLRTLELRMNHISKSVFEVTDFLKSHELTEKLYFPFDPDFAQYELAKKQLAKPTGLFSIAIKADNRGEIDDFCNALNYFLLACSWGGHESLVFPVCALDSSANYKNNEMPWNLIRFNIGLEDPKLLIEDIKQAYNKVFMKSVTHI